MDSANQFASVADGDVAMARMTPFIRDGYPTGSPQPNDPATYLVAQFTTTDQNSDGTNTIRCPTNPVTGINCPNPNFQDASGLNTGITASKPFYDANTTVGATGTTYTPVEWGYHESWEFYLQFCISTSRNLNLYTADQQLNGNSARFTRQNPNGDRHGLECPEERDYYPWWNPSPWKDVAVLVSDTAWCSYFKQNSQNVASRKYCAITDTARQNAKNQLIPITPAECTAAGGTWTDFPAWGIDAPDCKLAAISRDNHLGNGAQIDAAGNPVAGFPEANYYDWVLPAWMAGQTCVLRIRYNMSSADYPQVNVFTMGTPAGKVFTSKYNCPAGSTTQNGQDVDAQTQNDASFAVCSNVLTDNSTPLYNRPRVQISSDTTKPKLGIAFNTNQVGRTFQDRSYVFRVKSAPANAAGANIINLNFRGRRGNIVQTYPAVENDFTRNQLTVTNKDFVHIQFLGSDFNPNNNPNNGEGWKFSTRTNMVESRGKQNNFPKTLATASMFSDAAVETRMAYVDMNTANCGNYDGKNDDTSNNAIDNCGKLNNAPARFDGGLVQFQTGSYEYMSTRNNNFSNRSMKGTLTVVDSNQGLSAGASAGVVVGTVAGAAVLGFLGLRMYSKKNPTSKAAKVYGDITSRTTQTWERIKGEETTVASVRV
jgi:hypothetical protein